MTKRHRKRGTGSIFKHGTSWWIAFYDKGKLVRERVGSISLITKGMAELALKSRMGDSVQGKFNLEKTKKAISFNKLLEDYLKWAKDNHKAPERDFDAAKVLIKYFDGMDLRDINSWLIEKYKSDRKTQVKPGTINRELSITKTMFNLGIKWGLATVNPVNGVKLFKKSKDIPRALGDLEFVKVYESASVHFKPILLCAYLTGMRRGEIVRLKWKDVDFETDYIFVRETKNNESRKIPLNGMLKRELERLKQDSTSEYIFTTHKGTPYKYKDAFKRAWNTALRKSGIDKCRFHDLRHTFASNLIVKQKVDLITVSELTGHKDLSMLRRYGHTREEFKRDAIYRLGSELNITETIPNIHTTITAIKKPV